MYPKISEQGIATVAKKHFKLTELTSHKDGLPFLIPRMPARRECSLRCIRIAETREKPADRLKK